MPNQKDIQKAAEQTDAWLYKKEKRHMDMLEKSIVGIQDKILDSIQTLSTSDGKLDSLKVNMKQLQNVHRKIETLFQDDFSYATRSRIEEFKEVHKLLDKNYASFNAASKYRSIDKTVLDTLRDGYYADFLEVATEQKTKIVQQMYNQVIGGGSFSTLVNTIQQALTGSGSVGATGSSLAKYSKLYARDMLRNYHQSVNLIKADRAGLTHFLYVGNIIETSRDFCIERAGKYYTKEEINSWDKSTWKGKSGPAMTNRGGWNCRHHWQAIRPEWVDIKKGERLKIGDWHLEQNKKPGTKIVLFDDSVFEEQMQDSFSRLNQEWKTTAQEMKDNYNIKVQDAHDNPELSPYLTEEDVKQQVVVIKELKKEVERMEKDFPKLGEFLRSNGEETNLYLSNSQYITRVQNQNLNQGVLGCQIRNNIYIATQQEIGIERINLIKDMTKNWPEDTPLPFTVSSGLKATFRHELAHRYSATYLQGGQYYSSNSPLKDSFGGLLDGNRFEKLWRLHMMAENPGKSLLFVSRYGRTNEHEYFAEAFTAFTSPEYKSGMLSSSLEAPLKKLIEGTGGFISNE